MEIRLAERRVIDNVVDAHCDQLRCELILVQNETRLGVIQYVVSEGTPAILYIFVEENWRRTGVATAMVKKLQSLFPLEAIHWGFCSPDGWAFYNSLSFVEIETEYAVMDRELAEIKAKLEDYKTRHATKTLAMSEFDGWNDLHDRRDDLEREVGMESLYKRIIVH